MRILTAILLACTLTLANAEPQAVKKTVICADKIAVFEQLIKDFGEVPQWTGVSPTQATQVVLTVNLKTGAWTLVEYRDNWACILAVGEGSSSRWGTSVRLDNEYRYNNPQRHLYLH
jgi:hypothetical protein